MLVRHDAKELKRNVSNGLIAVRYFGGDKDHVIGFNLVDFVIDDEAGTTVEDILFVFHQIDVKRH